MNRDNLLFATIGVLVGFIAGYLLHEVMATRQPPRLTPEMRAQIVVPGGEQGGGGPAGGAEGDAGAGAAPAAGGAGGGGPASQEVVRLRAALEKNPNDTTALRELGNLNFNINDWLRAEDLYRRYLAIKPNDADVLTDLGVCYREMKKYQEALQQFKAAQNAAPDHWQSYFNEVVVLAFDLKKLDEANQTLAKLQQMQPGNPDVARLAGEVAKQRNAA